MRVEVRDGSGDLIWAFWADGSGKGGLTSRSYFAKDIQKQVVGILSDACVQACSELPDDGLREHVAALFSGFINEHVNSATGDSANLIDDALREHEARAQAGSVAASAVRWIRGVVHVRGQDDGIHCRRHGGRQRGWYGRGRSTLASRCERGCHCRVSVLSG